MEARAETVLLSTASTLPSLASNDDGTVAPLGAGAAAGTLPAGAAMRKAGAPACPPP